MYVGKTIHTLDQRWREHVEKSRNVNSHAYKCMLVVRSIAKHGVDAFTREVLEECDTHQTLMDAEIRWIAELNTTDLNIGYNLTLGGEGVIPTPETKSKMCEAQHGRKHSETSKAKMSAAHKGVKVSDETRRKMSVSHLGLERSQAHRDALSESLTGRVFSEEHCENIRLSKLGKPSKKTRRIGAFDPDTDEMIVEFASAVEANQLSNGWFLRASISLVCTGKRQRHRDMVWRYLDQKKDE